MRKTLLIVLLILLPVVAAEDIYHASSITTETIISSSIDIVPTGPAYSISYLDAELFFVPKDDAVYDVLALSTKPAARESATSLRYSWKDPEGTLAFSMRATVKTDASISRIQEKISFPITSVDADYAQYLRATEQIDIHSPGIAELAASLADGEDDLYIVVNKLATWTKNNVEYNLSTVTAEANQKASWVLRNKKGVCDEITNLFIALCRSLGIPARFVSGISYTNVPSMPHEWGPHGWAEVYFPGYGWVPFDPTYGEFGWVDASHIKLKESVDPKEPSTTYEWNGQQVDVQIHPLEIETTVQSYGEPLTPLVVITPTPFQEEVDFGSYNIITARVKNLKNYYITTEIALAQTTSMDILDQRVQQLILQPHEEQVVHWKVKVQDGLEKGYLYSFPILVHTVRNQTAQTVFRAAEDAAFFSRDSIEQEIGAAEETKSYSAYLDLSCDPAQVSFYYFEEAPLMQCVVKNTGEESLTNLRMCFEDDCRSFDLAAQKDTQFTFSIDTTKGKRGSPVIIDHADASKLFPVLIDVMDKPVIQIVDITSPSTVRFHDPFVLEFLLEKTSASAPEDIAVTIKRGGMKKTWNVPHLDANQKFVITLYGKDLRAGSNDILIDVDYADGAGTRYQSQETVFVELVDLTLWQRMMTWINSFGNWISSCEE